MLLIVGLGNPGPKYSLNRHNIGFMALDALAESYSENRWRKKFQGQSLESTLEGKKLLFLKPHTFMNNSGNSIGEAAKFYKIPPDQVMVFHDEIDLEPGKVRVKSGGEHAGHNGLRSIINHIGSDFVRVRMGVGHPGSKDLVHQYVLGNFSKKDQNSWLEHLLVGITKGFPYLIDGNSTEFLNKINLARPSKSDEKRISDSLKKPLVSKQKKEEGIFSKLSKFFG